MRQRRPILEQLFALPSDYDEGLAAYSMMLSLIELATDTAEAKPLKNLDASRLEVPPLFAGMPQEVISVASRRTFGDRQIVEDIARRAGANPDEMRRRWSAWQRLILRFDPGVRDRYLDLDDLPFGNLA